jgi:penicillin-binding protein 1B
MRIKITKSFIKRCVIYSLLVILVILSVASGYTYVVINELKHKIELQNLKPSKLKLRESKVEADSYVLADDFDFYVKFLKEKDQTIYEKLEKTRGKYLVKEDFVLSPPIVNECEKYRCLQNRINFENIPSNLWKGLMGIEDFRFLDHKGIDPISIARAIIVDLKAMSFVQGGSTLTQQLAKNLFLSNEKKFQRKIQEMIYAIYIENNFSKDEIITMYFNEVFWGVVGGISLKGISMASLVYFEKEPIDLTPFESTILIGMLKGPIYYNPAKHLDRLKVRTEAVWKRLLSLKLFREDSPIWSEDDWNKWQKRIIKYSETHRLVSLFRVLSNDDLALEPYEKFSFNRAVNYTLKELSARIEGLDIAIKTFVIDLGCEGIECDNIFSYYSKFERNKVKAIYEEKHQVGSILKPLIYNEFLRLGKSLDDIVSVEEITLDLKSGKWTPDDVNYGDIKEITLKQAIQKSRNRPLIRTAVEVGLDNLEQNLLKIFPSLLTPLKEYPAQLLGAIELSLSNVSSAYLSFFNNQCEKVEKSELEFEDTLVYALAQAEKTTIRLAANDIIKNSLIFGKTGTTNNGLDNWYIASDGDKFYINWFGVDSKRENKELRLYGSNSAFKIFQYFISYRGKQLRDFYCLK